GLEFRRVLFRSTPAAGRQSWSPRRSTPAEGPWPWGPDFRYAHLWPHQTPAGTPAAPDWSSGPVACRAEECRGRGVSNCGPWEKPRIRGEGLGTRGLQAARRQTTGTADNVRRPYAGRLRFFGGQCPPYRVFEAWRGLQPPLVLLVTQQRLDALALVHRVVVLEAQLGDTAQAHPA